MMPPLVHSIITSLVSGIRFYDREDSYGYFRCAGLMALMCLPNIGVERH